MGRLRLLLALSVIASHVGPILGFELIGGSLAVQSFFIISGFYMSLILNEKYIGPNSSFKLFITNRLLRLYPVYLVVLVLTLVVVVIIGHNSSDSSYPILDEYAYAGPDKLSSIFLVFTNIFIWGQDLVMFLGINSDTGKLFFTDNFWNTSPKLYNFLFIPQGWSLALEMTFYLIAPFLLRKRVRFVCIIILLSLAVRIIIYYLLALRNDPWTYRFFPSELTFFLFGCISYRIYQTLNTMKIPKIAGLLTLATVIGLTMIYPILPQSSLQIFHFHLKDILYIGCIIFSTPVLFIISKKNKFDFKIGELSYPVYIVHLLIAKICGALAVGIFNNPFSIIVLSIIAAYLLNKAVVEPIDRLRQKRLTKTCN
ncbi:acyltransferase family protein [Mucilaginibacter psychrotolerans]|uniref:Acyltransferase n=1 Tax=Mucilaginibacter psychrotolerans TaxID=1524096 RepID=A0A4Y8SBW2_9SPHI|nr:acyltransferase [Mucilaginibacter psychrotolerans]TFF36141.1 acyltransferase [Mucilaginibacter psychrotolerans]